MNLLTAWSAFYTMVGSAAAGLTGLMFVVITLVPRDRALENTDDGIGTFSTPTVLNLTAVLVIAAIFLAPWRTIVLPVVLMVLAGTYGVLFTLRTMWRANQLEFYTPDASDALWYHLLPLASYAAIGIGALCVLVTPAALYAVAAGAVFLVVIAIRNAWDVVTYIASGRSQAQGEQKRDSGP